MVGVQHSHAVGVQTTDQHVNTRSQAFFGMIKRKKKHQRFIMFVVQPFPKQCSAFFCASSARELPHLVVVLIKVCLAQQEVLDHKEIANLTAHSEHFSAARKDWGLKSLHCMVRWQGSGGICAKQGMPSPCYRERVGAAWKHALCTLRCVFWTRD